MLRGEGGSGRIGAADEEPAEAAPSVPGQSPLLRFRYLK
jgi:hypothetical protein